MDFSYFFWLLRSKIYQIPVILVNIKLIQRVNKKIGSTKLSDLALMTKSIIVKLNFSQSLCFYE